MRKRYRPTDMEVLGAILVASLGLVGTVVLFLRAVWFLLKL